MSQPGPTVTPSVNPRHDDSAGVPVIILIIAALVIGAVTYAWYMQASAPARTGVPAVTDNTPAAGAADAMDKSGASENAGAGAAR